MGFLGRLQFGVDIRFLNRQFFSVTAIHQGCLAPELVALFLRKVEWKSFSPNCDVGSSLRDLQTVSQVHSLRLVPRRLCCVLAK